MARKTYAVDGRLVREKSGTTPGGRSYVTRKRSDGAKFTETKEPRLEKTGGTISHSKMTGKTFKNLKMKTVKGPKGGEISQSSIKKGPTKKVK